MARPFITHYAFHIERTAMATVLLDSVRAWWPEIILSLGGLAVALLGAFSLSPRVAWGATLATVAAATAALAQAPVPPPTGVFFGLIVCDPFSLAFRWLSLWTVMLVAVLVMASRELANELQGEVLGLVLLIGVGLMLMAEANHLLMAYVALELVSISSYLLVGMLREPRSAEAALKYLLFGALSSGVMLFGMSLLYGLTGALDFPSIARAAAALPPAASGALVLAVILMLAGLAFKISMVPFHMWTPDVYEGAPTAVTAFLSVGPKAAGLALLMRLLDVLQPAWPVLAPALIALTGITMTLGNLVALVQTNVKRLLAYSTIAQVGYLLMGLVVQTGLGESAVVFYLIAYLFMNLGAFACVVAVQNATGSESVEAYRGLAQRSPVLALLLAICLLSLAGIPPFLGFFGKFLLFGAAVQAGYVPLAVIAAVNSAIALYYYVNLIRLMYFLPAEDAAPLRPDPALRAAAGVCAAVTVLLGVFPTVLLRFLAALLQNP
jgi:NADH-quinone oxidoreductase subunit N